MAVVDPPAGVGLNAFREIGPPRKGSHSVEQEIANCAGAERQNAVTHKGRDLQVDVAEMFLQRQQADCVASC